MSTTNGNDNASKKYLKHQLVLLVVTVLGHGLKHTFNSAFFVLLPEIKAGLLLSKGYEVHGMIRRSSLEIRTIIYHLYELN